MNLDEITYGNPSVDKLQYLYNETYVDSLFIELSKYGFPSNSSQATKEELNQIVDAVNILSSNEDYIKRYYTYDVGLIKYFTDGLIQLKENSEEIVVLINDAIKDTLPLLTKLKYHFQRPRPYQLAEYYKLKLFPFSSSSSHTPSFPSGHSFQAKILTEIIGNKYPELYANMQKVFDDICYSRLYLGLHYQSDIDVGIFCAEKVLKMQEFKTKYRL